MRKQANRTLESVLFDKGVFAYAADGTDPVFRDVSKCGSRGNPAIGVTSGRIVHIATNSA